MTISNQNSTLTVTDVLTTNKAWLHLILYGDETLNAYDITSDISTFELTTDGWFIIESYLLDEYDFIQISTDYYILKVGAIKYLYKGDQICAMLNEYDKVRTVLTESDSTNVFMLCNIESCLGILNTDILDQYMAGVNCSAVNTSKSDIVYMTYSTLQYMAKRGHFAEAQRLLDKINKCGYLCGQSSANVPCNCGS